MDLLEKDPIKGVYAVREQLFLEHGGLRGWHEHIVREQKKDIAAGKKYYTPQEYRMASCVMR